MEGFLVTQGISSVIPLLHHHNYIVSPKIIGVNFSFLYFWTIPHEMEYPFCMETNLPIRKGENLLEMIASSLFSALFLLLYLKPDLLAIYQKGAEPIPMLQASSAKALLLGLFLFSLGTLIVSVIKIIRKQWSKPLVWANSMGELALSLYFAFFMTRWDALNKEFIRFFRNDLATWALIAKAAVACYLLLTLISIADDLYKVYRNK